MTLLNLYIYGMTVFFLVGTFYAGLSARRTDSALLDLLFVSMITLVWPLVTVGLLCYGIGKWIGRYGD